MRQARRINPWKNEKGYALVFVLLTIALLMPLSVVLIHQNVNSSRQLYSTESYNSAIALAEMGMIRAEAEIRNQLDSFDMDVIREGNPDLDQASEAEIVQTIADSIIRNIGEDGIHFINENAAYKVNLTVSSATASEIIFAIQSIGRTDLDYEINAEIILETNLSMGSPEENNPEEDSNNGADETPGGGGSGDFVDPDNFLSYSQLLTEIERNILPLHIDRNHTLPNQMNHHITDSVQLTSILNLGSGATLHATRNIFAIHGINVSGPTIHIEGDLEARGNFTWTNQSYGRIDGGIVSTNGMNLTQSRLTVGDEMAIRGNSTITQSDVVIGNRIANTNTVTLNSSTVSFNNDGGMNSLIIENNSTMRTKNFHVNNNFEVNGNSQLVVDGSFNINGWTGNLNNSELIVQGHMRFSTLNLNNSVIVIRGDARSRPNAHIPISFNNAGSRVIIYGERTPNIPTTGGWNWNVITQENERECRAANIENANLICFATGNPQPGDENEQENESDGSGNNENQNEEIDFHWEDDFNLQNIEYIGIR